MPAMNNLVLCLMKQKKYMSAWKLSQYVSALDKDNYKSLHRECEASIEI